MPDVVLNMENISVRINRNLILKQVSFELRRGEIHALIGENGAGKTMLMKVLMGIVRATSGRILVDGKPCAIDSPGRAYELGFHMLFQDDTLFSNLDIAHHIFLNQDRGWKNGFARIDSKKLYADAQRQIDQAGLELDVRAVAGSLSKHEMKLVNIIIALNSHARVLILDEPTASFSEAEAAFLFQELKKLKESGVSIILISHKIEEILGNSDRITILRDGSAIETLEVPITNVDQIITQMAGIPLSKRYPRIKAAKGGELLSVKNLSTNNLVNDVSFSICGGEIVGIAGLLGSGRTELAEAIFGVCPIHAGSVSVYGKKKRIRSPKAAIKAGIGYVASDRKVKGIFGNMSVLENIAIARHPKIKGMCLINRRKMVDIAYGYIRRLGIKVADATHAADYLSAGNQQKTVLAKWFNMNSRIFIFDDPTAEIDTASKVDIYNIMNELVNKGRGLLLISSDMNELLGMCDRIIIMYEGTNIKEFQRNEATAETLFHYMSCGKAEPVRRKP